MEMNESIGRLWVANVNVKVTLELLWLIIMLASKASKKLVSSLSVRLSFQFVKSLLLAFDFQIRLMSSTFIQKLNLLHSPLAVVIRNIFLFRICCKASWDMGGSERQVLCVLQKPAIKEGIWRLHLEEPLNWDIISSVLLTRGYSKHTVPYYTVAIHFSLRTWGICSTHWAKWYCVAMDKLPHTNEVRMRKWQILAAAADV